MLCLLTDIAYCTKELDYLSPEMTGHANRAETRESVLKYKPCDWCAGSKSHIFVLWLTKISW